MPQLIAGLSWKEAGERAGQLLDYMRIGHRGSHRPGELSGGEQQRVAIARAVANAPTLLLADEPTGNLDPETASYVFDALEALVRQSGLAALIATHNHELARRMLKHAGEALNVTASFGIASRITSVLTPDQLMKQADLALYEAKNTGRNRVVAAAA